MPSQTHFLVIGSRRSGTTHLKNLLRSHKQVICYGELLNPSRILWDYEGMNDEHNSEALLNSRESNPVGFIDQIYSMMDEPEISAVGFKALYEHFGSSPQRRALLTHLCNKSDLRIVHIKRNNVFKTFCSDHIAQLRVQRGTSMNAYSPDDVENNISITIDSEQCLRFITATKVEEAKMDALFAPLNPHAMMYEDLAANMQQTMAGVLEYLELEQQELHSPNHKVRQQPISKVVSNYSEVRERLTQAGFEEFFSDET